MSINIGSSFDTFLTEEGIKEEVDKEAATRLNEIKQPLKTGDIFILNGRGDLGINEEIRPHIGNQCIVIKTCKSGLIQIKMCGVEKAVFSVAKYNLSPRPDYSATWG